MRWRLHTVPPVRRLIGIVGLAAIAAVTVFAAAHAGDTVWTLSGIYGPTNAAGQWATTVLISASNGSAHYTLLIAAAAVMSLTFASPLSAERGRSLIAKQNLAGIQTPRSHGYFDAAVIHGFSALGFLQLLTLLMIASVLAADADRLAALLTAVACWVALSLLAATATWVFASQQPATRLSRGAHVAVYMTASGIATALAAAPVLPNGNSLLTQALTPAPWPVFATRLAVLAALSLGAATIGLTAVLTTATQPSRARTTRAHKTIKMRLPNSTGLHTLTAFVATLAWRNPSTSAGTVVATVATGALAAVTTTSQGVISFSITGAIALVVGLTFTVNAFGILGPGLPWLASIPNALKRLPVAVAATGASITLAASLTAWAPTVATGRIPTDKIPTLAATIIVTTLLASRWCLDMAIKRPYPTAGTVGQTSTPMVAALTDTLRLSLLTGLSSWCCAALSPHPAYLYGFVALVTAWCGLRFMSTLTAWKHPMVQSATLQKAIR